MTYMGDHLATGVREAITRQALPALSSRLRIETTTHHRMAGLRGAADLAFERIFTAAAK